MQTLRNIAAALSGDVISNRYVLCPGPGHSGNDRSLKVKFKPDGSFSVTSFAGDDWQVCKDYVRERLGLPNDWQREAANEDALVISLRECDDDERARIRSALQRWSNATPMAGTLAETYLASRALSYRGDAIRFRENDRTMVALMTDIVTNEPTGVHCTYLDRDGRKTERKMRGRALGAVVRLSPDEDVHYGLAIGEGIETCLATGFTPIWACLSAGTMERFPVLPVIQALTIFADRDYAGMSAANACGRRWHEAGREVEIVAPSEIGADFADELEAA
jgi:putative DNA primase/helicase